VAVPTRLATASDVGDIAQSLALAFEDDPVWRFLVPDPAKRVKRCVTIFTAMLRIQHLPHSVSFTDVDRVGAALWDHPGHWRMTAWQVLRGTPAFVRGFGAGTVRALSTLAVMERRHPRNAHYYLAILGTRPDYQGKGIGSSLMRPVLDRCDREGIGAYLESSKESNIAFYRRHGFEVTGEVVLPGGPTVWPMWRDPQVPASE
jgi:ribosomal protein S18 acetylase RimI-like enzyme